MPSCRPGSMRKAVLPYTKQIQNAKDLKKDNNSVDLNYR
jgi:hypothetical protein